MLTISFGVFLWLINQAGLQISDGFAIPTSLLYADFLLFAWAFSPFRAKMFCSWKNRSGGKFPPTSPCVNGDTAST